MHIFDFTQTLSCPFDIDSHSWSYGPLLFH